MELNKVYLGDSLETIKTFPDESIDCVVTSPPYYGLRDYGVDGQIGLEDSPEAYIDRLVLLFREVRRVLKKDGTCWVNLGDSYWGGGWRNASFNEHSGDIQKGSKGTYCGESMPPMKGFVNGYKPKDLVGIPWMFEFAMRADGWYLRQDIIWHKPNPMPESVTDRCTKSHEYIFLFSKSERYYFDYEAIMEPCADQERDNYQSGSRTYGENADRNDNDLGERSKTWMPKRKSEQGYSKAGGHRDQSGGYPSRSLSSMNKDNAKNLHKYGGEIANTIHKNRAAGIPDPDYYMRNKRDVWSVNVKPNKEAHFATYPQELITPCILAGCKDGGAVLDPFMGSGTTGIVARLLNRNFVGCELNPDYQKMATRRIFNEGENLFNQGD